MPRGVNMYDEGRIQRRNFSASDNIQIISPGVVTGGLVLHLDAGNYASYPASGTTWYDLTNSLSDSKLTNGPTFNLDNGGAIVFDGTNDYSESSKTSTLRNQNFTVSCWANFGVQNLALITLIDFDHAFSGPSTQGWVIQSEDATTNRNYYLAWYDGTAFQPAGGFGPGKGLQITTSTWTNIVYAKSGTSLLGYINASQLYSATATNSNVSYLDNKKLLIADYTGVAPRRYFKGNVSSVQIYNRALSPQEIAQNFNATRARFGI
jgi:hypothetical protein